MMIADLVAYLKGNAGVQAKVGTRINLDVLAEASLMPAIVIYELPSDRTQYIGGGFDGFNSIQLEIENLGNSKPDADATAEAVKAALDGFSNQMMGATYVQGILVRAEEDALKQYATRLQYCHTLTVLAMHS